MRRRLIAFGAVVLVSSVAEAQATNVACWFRDLEQVEETTNPPEGGDIDFFTASAVVPNIIWILDNSGSMQTIPCNMDCGLDSLAYAYQDCTTNLNTSGFVGDYSDAFFVNQGYSGYEVGNVLNTDKTPGATYTAYPAFDSYFCSPSGTATAYSGTDGCYYPGIVYKHFDTTSGVGVCGTKPPTNSNTWITVNATAAESTIYEYCLAQYGTLPPSTTSYSYTDANTCHGGSSPVACPTNYTCSSTTSTLGTCSTTKCNVGVTACPTGYSCSGSTCTLPSTCSSIGCPIGYTCDPAWNQCILPSTTGTPNTLLCQSNLEQYGYDPYVASGSPPSGLNGDQEHPVFTGDLLNFFPPKFVMAREVLKTTVTTVPPARQALFSFNNDSQVSCSGQCSGGGQLHQALTPICENFFNGSGIPQLPTQTQFQASAQGIVNVLNGLAADGGTSSSPIVYYSGTPWAETETTVLQYVAGYQANFANKVTVHGITGAIGLDGGYAFPNNISDVPDGGYDSVCVSCQHTFVVQVTDGAASSEEGSCSSGSTPCPAASFSGGVPCALQNYDDDCREGEMNSPSCQRNSASACQTARVVEPQQTGGDFVDDVAAFAFNEDLRIDMAGTQNVLTYAVAMLTPTINSPILERMAAEGGTNLMIYANNAAQLKGGLNAIVQDISSRGTAFSAASVSTVETRGTTYAFIPRFQPSNQALWIGHLFRFNLFNEFSAGCTISDYNKVDAVNPNGNASCNDVYLEDANGNFVQENSLGQYQVVDTTQAWSPSTGWPLLVPATAATPFWDAAANLQARNLTSSPRQIWTVVDSNNNGTLEPSEMLAFSTANLATIEPSLALEGPNGPICTSFASLAGKSPYTTEAACAQDFMNWVIGFDMLGETGAACTSNSQCTSPSTCSYQGKCTVPTGTRTSIFSDIFHSAPILVTPPVAELYCATGFENQCLYSIYQTNLTPSSPAGADAYATYVTNNQNRTEFVLVGGNDGFLHAFDAGDWSGSPATLNNGTGQELWAFIPPDLLPKLKRLINQIGRHELFVDGTPMVRDIWYDTNGDHKKESNEFFTVAVVGERQGGRGWSALDVTTPATPKFLWADPPIGDTHGLSAGQSWDDFAPSPPPIGPVAIADTGSGAITVGGTKADEVWSVFLNGGYDPDLLRGRGMRIMNAYTGSLLWRFDAVDSTGTTDLRSKLFPIAAPLAMYDIGDSANATGQQDAVFDTAAVGDIMGQLWVARFFQPGVIVNGVVSNWYAARGFIEFNGSTLADRNPFFQMAQETVDSNPNSGEVRVYLGSGDRANIRDPNGGSCDPVNLVGCIRQGCNVTLNPITNQNGVHYENADIAWTSASTSMSTDTVTLDSASVGNTCADATNEQVTATVACGSGASAVDAGWSWQLACNWTDTSSPCQTITERPAPIFSTLGYAAGDAGSTTQPARFYGVQLFSGATDGGTAVRAPFDTATAAAAYDSAALTDSSLWNADTDAGTGPGAGQAGWYVDYANYNGINERTSNVATILNGVVVWDTETPDSNPLDCGGQVQDTDTTYQAAFDTGAVPIGALESGGYLLPDGGLGMAINDYALPDGGIAAFNTGNGARVTEVSTNTPAVTHSAVLSVNPVSGNTQELTVSVPTGTGQSAIGMATGLQQGALGTVSWHEISREEHKCRHQQNGDGGWLPCPAMPASVIP